jgi:signal transduction histidine kinase
MKRLIDDILSVYKLDMRLEFCFTGTKIAALVDQVVLELSSILKEKEIVVKRAIMLQEGEDMIVSCDALRISQVLVNLIRNAVDFLPASTGKIEILVEDEDLIAGNGSGTKPAAILISVADNGPGIQEEKASSLFKKFYQVTPTAPRKHGGTGLGLTICKEIVEMHGGKIWHDSSHKNGACFRFTIPRVAPTNRGKNVVA